MKWPWKRDSTAEKDIDALLAEANVASPTAAQPVSAPAGPFRMTVQDVFTITGRGTVATGQIEAGSVTVGQQVRVTRVGTELGATTVTGVEMFRKKLDTANAGDNVGLLMNDSIGRGLMAGDVLES